MPRHTPLALRSSDSRRLRDTAAALSTGAGARPGPLPLASGASLLPWGVPVPSYAADCDSLLDLYST